MELWQGNCYVHVEFTRESIEKIRAEYPDAPVVAHPECTYAVRMLADEVCSTEKMITLLPGIVPRSVHHRDRERACCIGCGARFPERRSSPGRRTTARARIAGS